MTAHDAEALRDRIAILQSLDLPDEAIPLFLAHIDNFCAAHGGAKTYGDLLALVKKYQAAQGCA